ncbi:antibiotic biosynthesis monooxygenase [Leptothermofonsia sp. ETS-13]|uniref:antibiotic biosynthesis monooxygenase n=1 Tax=Leptothermofonsia sp. ETS-13 TaxID=3035696 RepID=UPI003BA00EC5
MSEFQDFLKRQYAHVAVGEFKLGKFCEAQSLYEQAVATYTHGFKGAYLLRDPGSDKGISVIFWESVEDMADNESETYQAILKKMAPLFAHSPDVFVYEVVSELKPPESQLETLEKVL